MTTMVVLVVETLSGEFIYLKELKTKKYVLMKII